MQKHQVLNIDKALGTVSKEQVYAQEAKAMECIATLHNGNGAGNDIFGLVTSPLFYHGRRVGRHREYGERASF